MQWWLISAPEYNGLSGVALYASVVPTSSVLQEPEFSKVGIVTSEICSRSSDIRCDTSGTCLKREIDFFSWLLCGLGFHRKFHSLPEFLSRDAFKFF